MDDAYREAWGLVLAATEEELSPEQRRDLLELYPHYAAAGDQVADIIDQIHEADGLLEQREEFAACGSFDRIKNALIAAGHTTHVAHAATTAALIARCALYRGVPSPVRVQMDAEGIARRVEDPTPPPASDLPPLTVRNRRIAIVAVTLAILFMLIIEYGCARVAYYHHTHDSTLGVVISLAFFGAFAACLVGAVRTLWQLTHTPATSDE